MAEPPYSDDFIDLIVEIVEPIAESLNKAMEVKTVVWEFLSKFLDCLEEKEYQSLTQFTFRLCS
jgi:hypothetical protein